MRILYLSNSFPPVVSGTSILAVRIAKWMSSHHKIGVICPKYDLMENIDYGFKTFRLPSAPILLRKGFNFILPIPGPIREAFEKFNPDVVHIYDPSPASLILLRLARNKGIPIVVSHFFYPQFLLEYFRVAPTATGKKPGKLATWLLRAIMKQYEGASKIIVLTQIIRNYIVRTTNIPVEIISAGVDYASFGRMAKNQITNICRHYFIPEKPWVLYVGRLDQDKNLPIMIKTWAMVCRQHKNLILLIVGDGTIREKLKKMTMDHKINERVYFTGTMPEADLPAVYLSRFSRAFFITSKVETQSIVTLQALAAGLPVVAANSGALPELVRPGVNGMLCDPDNPTDYAKGLNQVLSGKLKNDRVKHYGQFLAKKHDFSYSKQLYLKLYEDVIGVFRQPPNKP